MQKLWGLPSGHRQPNNGKSLAKASASRPITRRKNLRSGSSSRKLAGSRLRLGRFPSRRNRWRQAPRLPVFAAAVSSVGGMKAGEIRVVRSAEVHFSASRKGTEPLNEVLVPVEILPEWTSLPDGSEKRKQKHKQKEKERSIVSVSRVEFDGDTPSDLVATPSAEE